MYHALLRSSRLEMSNWMRAINAEFLTEVGITVDRLNGIQLLKGRKEDCFANVRNEAGSEIQEIVREAIAEFEFYERDYVYLLLDTTDQYISFNQKWPKTVWAEFNMIHSMDLILSFMETIIYLFYTELFEAQVEEIIIEMINFEALVENTRNRTFIALQSVSGRFEEKLAACGFS